ncbi:Flp family type IVb pilin [Ponticaulis koreensis]|uniref:Flp family type IVb pilin n=1 Tax=Ponticaulis koreensis TaxID=1123045 RepID=UPI0003B60CDA|nr:Flp family type IVb pilin [Ponticaulis koreensis]
MSARRKITSFSKAKGGATSIEYGLICALIVIGLIAAITSWGNSATDMYEGLDADWDAAQGA